MDAPRPRRRFHKRKTCKFCEDCAIVIDYKEVKMLKMFITERGKIIPRRITGNCAKHQRKVTTALKRSRNIAPDIFLVRPLNLTSAHGAGVAAKCIHGSR